MSEFNAYRLAVIFDRLSLGGICVFDRMCGVDEDNVEVAVFLHAFERTLALPYCQRAGLIVVGHGYVGVVPLFIIVVGALVLVEVEASVLSGIHKDGNRFVGRL